MTTCFVVELNSLQTGKTLRVVISRDQRLEQVLHVPLLHDITECFELVLGVQRTLERERNLLIAWERDSPSGLE